MIRRMLFWGFWILVIFYIATDPAGAAGLVHQIWGWLHSAATSLIAFLHDLGGQ